MQYLSTRGGARDKGFANVLIEGLAPDGGLYVPDSIPKPHISEGPYARAASTMMRPFIEPDPLGAEIEYMAAGVYARFHHPDVAPIRRVSENLHILELFWGPTLSFKDYALQMVGAMFDRVLSRTDRRILVLGATSGDTGSAAIEACRGRAGIDIVILFPDGAVSEVQRRQMTTVADGNVHAVAVKGTFDDCQRLVKAAFLQSSLPLAAINSINWGRIMAQTAYYAYASSRFSQPVDFVVPTGNFGNILAGHVARRMGANVGRLTVANNANHGLTDLIKTGRLRVRPVKATHAPAMDIQIPSNLERYLYEAVGDDPRTVVNLEEGLNQSGELHLPNDARDRIRADFAAGWRSDSEIVDAIRRLHQESGIIADPHTAVAWSVATEHPVERPTVVISTAHPAKFAPVVELAIGRSPDLPDEVAALMDLPEHLERIDPRLDQLLDLLTGVGAGASSTRARNSID
jgi:threonine synthase